MGSIPTFVHTELEQLGIEPSGELLRGLDGYLDLILDHTRRVNLTAVRDRDTAWRRLILDSLTLSAGLDGLSDGVRVVDVGSGGGVPGVPLAIAHRDLSISLLETTGKKTAFLGRVIETLDLAHANTIQARAEDAGRAPETRQSFEVAVARALGSVSLTLEYALPLVRVGGRVLILKDARARAELEDATDALAILGAGEVRVFDAYPAAKDEDLVIIVIEKDRPTPAAYPRRPGVPKQSPL